MDELMRPQSPSPHRRWLVQTGVATVAAALPILSQAQDQSQVIYERDIERSGYFVHLGVRALFNVKASVSRTAPAGIGPGYYDNGFVLPDIGGSESGLTWNWGYQQQDQVVGDQLRFTRLDNVPDGGTLQDHSSDVSVGGEIVGGVEFGRIQWGKREIRIGAEVGYGYNPYQFEYAGVTAGSSGYTEAAYNLNGILPPVAPYAGTATGPGPLIDLAPATLSTTPTTSQSSFSGDFKTDLHNLKLGVWAAIPIHNALYTAISFGYASVLADARFQFSEDLTFGNAAIPAVALSATAEERKWNPGFYLQWRLGYDLSRYIGVHIGADYQWNDLMHFSGGGRDLKLDFRYQFAATAAIRISF